MEQSLQDSILFAIWTGELEEHHELQPRLVKGLETELQKFILWNPSLESSILEKGNRAFQARFYPIETDFMEVGFTLRKTIFQKLFSCKENRVY